MPHLVHQAAFYLHVVLGSIGLVIFWLPFFAQKGGKNHVNFGKIFAYSMYAVGTSGLLMSSLVIIDPIAVRLPPTDVSPEKMSEFIYQNRVFAGFLFMLSILVICNVRQAILVLKVKADRSKLKSPLHLALVGFLMLSALTIGGFGIKHGILLLEIFALLSLILSARMVHYIFKKNLKPREWILAHLSNIGGAGIAAYTAFFAFGGRKIFEELLTGNLQVIPWVLPAIIGTVGLNILTKKYTRQYKITQTD